MFKKIWFSVAIGPIFKILGGTALIVVLSYFDTFCDNGRLLCYYDRREFTGVAVSIIIWSKLSYQIRYFATIGTITQ